MPQRYFDSKEEKELTAEQNQGAASSSKDALSLLAGYGYQQKAKDTSNGTVKFPTNTVATRRHRRPDRAQGSAKASAKAFKRTLALHDTGASRLNPVSRLCFGNFWVFFPKYMTIF